MTYLIIAILSLLIGASVVFYRFYLPAFTKKKAQESLLDLIFPDGNEQLQEVMRVFHQLTNQRFTDDQILDYFMKIKGLQTLDFSIKTNFWIKKYLLSSTDIKLNYFEQVKFYETFMNYPKSFEVIGKKKLRHQSSEILFNKEPQQASFLKREYA